MIQLSESLHKVQINDIFVPPFYYKYIPHDELKVLTENPNEFKWRIPDNHKGDYVFFGIRLSMWTYAARKLSYNYKIKRIKKKDGKSFRQLEIPADALKMLQKEIILPILEKIELPDYVLSFRKGISLDKSAEQHVNKETLIKMDLKNYFPSIKFDMIQKIMDNLFTEKVEPVLSPTFTKYNKDLVKKLYKIRSIFFDIYVKAGYPSVQKIKIKKFKEALPYVVAFGGHHLPQGAPTSPAISNIAFLDYDLAIKWVVDKYSGVYTRYADDLIISGDFDRNTAREIIDRINNIIEKSPFNISHKKTGIFSGEQRKKVLGIVVNKTMNPVRYKKRLWRAIKYNINKNGFEIEAKKSGYSSVKAFYEHWKGVLNFWSSFNPIYRKEIEELDALKKMYQKSFDIEQNMMLQAMVDETFV